MDSSPIPVSGRLTIERTDPRADEAASLLAGMCAELTHRCQRPPSTYTVEEALAPRAGFVVARLDGQPIGCGALRCIDETTVEVKRMYVAPSGRRRGIARLILSELERVAAGHRYTRVILETGVFQPEAIALYAAAGYRRTSSYGRYVGHPDAVCFEKQLT